MQSNEGNAPTAPPIAGLPLVRVKLPCDDEQEFLAKLAGSIGAKGLFVPSETPKPIGSRVTLRAELRGSGGKVEGEAVVDRHSAPGKKPGMIVRLSSLSPESIQFVFAPVDLPPLESVGEALQRSAELGLDAQARPDVNGLTTGASDEGGSIQRPAADWGDAAIPLPAPSQAGEEVALSAASDWSEGVAPSDPSEALALPPASETSEGVARPTASDTSDELALSAASDPREDLPPSAPSMPREELHPPESWDASETHPQQVSVGASGEALGSETDSDTDENSIPEFNFAEVPFSSGLEALPLPAPSSATDPIPRPTPAPIPSAAPSSGVFAQPSSLRQPLNPLLTPPPIAPVDDGSAGSHSSSGERLTRRTPAPLAPEMGTQAPVIVFAEAPATEGGESLDGNWDAEFADEDLFSDAPWNDEEPASHSSSEASETSGVFAASGDDDWSLGLENEPEFESVGDEFVTEPTVEDTSARVATSPADRASDSTDDARLIASEFTEDASLLPSKSADDASLLASASSADASLLAAVSSDDTSLLTTASTDDPARAVATLESGSQASRPSSSDLEAPPIAVATPSPVVAGENWAAGMPQTLPRSGANSRSSRPPLVSGPPPVLVEASDSAKPQAESIRPDAPADVLTRESPAVAEPARAGSDSEQAVASAAASTGSSAGVIEHDSDNLDADRGEIEGGASAASTEDDAPARAATNDEGSRDSVDEQSAGEALHAAGTDSSTNAADAEALPDAVGADADADADASPSAVVADASPGAGEALHAAGTDSSPSAVDADASPSAGEALHAAGTDSSTNAADADASPSAVDADASPSAGEALHAAGTDASTNAAGTDASPYAADADASPSAGEVLHSAGTDASLYAADADASPNAAHAPASPSTADADVPPTAADAGASPSAADAPASPSTADADASPSAADAPASPSTADADASPSAAERHALSPISERIDAALAESASEEAAPEPSIEPHATDSEVELAEDRRGPGSEVGSQASAYVSTATEPAQLGVASGGEGSSSPTSPEDSAESGFVVAPLHGATLAAISDASSSDASSSDASSSDASSSDASSSDASKSNIVQALAPLLTSEPDAPKAPGRQTVVHVYEPNELSKSLADTKELPKSPADAKPAAGAKTPVPATDSREALAREAALRASIARVDRPSPQGAESKPSLAPFSVVGTYQILKRLGAGGMAEVYLARSNFGAGVDKLVAFKTVLPKFGPETPVGRLFLNEAKISVSLEHSNVANVFDYGDPDGRPYLAMEYVHGRDVTAVLQALRGRGRPPPIEFAVAVVLEVARALEYLHEKKDLDGRPLNLVHRDVSPGNVLISERGDVKLVDFGVAASAHLAGQNMLVGKYAYMAPEQSQGANAQPSWDIYSLGVVLHELVTLERLFKGTTPREKIFSERSRGQLPPSASNPEVPAILDRIVLTTTDADVTKRYSSARALRQALEKAQDSVGRCDVSAMMHVLFADELATQQKELETLIVEGRRRLASMPRTATINTITEFIEVEIPAPPPAKWPKVLAAVMLGLALVGGIGGVIGKRYLDEVAAEESYRAIIDLADERLQAGRWIGPGNDEALDHLMRAKAQRPDDPRVSLRLRKLSEAFEDLGRGALGRGDAAEAAVHFSASLQADPSRTHVKKLIEEAETMVLTRSKKKTGP